MGLGIRADHQGNHFPWEEGHAMGNPTVLDKIPNLRLKRRRTPLEGVTSLLEDLLNMKTRSSSATFHVDAGV